MKTQKYITLIWKLPVKAKPDKDDEDWAEVEI